MAPIDVVSQAIAQAIVDAIEKEKGTLGGIAKDGGDAAAGGMLGDVGRLTGIVSDVLNAIPIVGGIIDEATNPLAAVENAGGKFGRGFGMGYLMGYIGFQIAQPAFRTYVQDSERVFHSLEIDPATAAQMSAKRVAMEYTWEFEAAGSGLDGSKFGALREGSLAYPALGELLEMSRRKLIGDDLVTLALQRNSIPDAYMDGLRGLSRLLLSPADLALANLRGAIDDATMQGYADQLGVTADDMAVLIANTGEPPGPEQLMEAIRRKFIDKDRFDRGIRQSRVRNEWIDVEYALRNSPMSVADAVRAVVENYLTSDEGAAIAEQNGLLPEHWSIMVESWGRPLSHEQMMQLYHRQKATLDEVHQAFRESDLKDKYIDQAVELGRRLVPERTIVSMLDHGVVTHDRATQMLSELGFNTDDANSLIALGVAQRTHAAKALTKADLVTMYEDSLLTRQAAVDKLVALGYPRDDAGTLLDLADAKKAASALKTTERGIEASLKAHHLTEQEAITQLTAAGVEPRQAQGLVDAWVHERGTPTRSLTEAQILSLGEHSVITPDDVRTRLIGYGLVPGDADLLMKLHGIGQPAAPVAPPPATTATPPAAPPGAATG